MHLRYPFRKYKVKMIRNGNVFFHEHFDIPFTKFIINHFLALVVIVIDSKRGKHSLLIRAFLFHSLQISKIGCCQNYIFIMEKNSNSLRHNVEQNWSIFFRITWKGKWKLIIECLYFLLSLWNQYIAGSCCIKIKYIFTIIKSSFFSPLMKINNNLG